MLPAHIAIKTRTLLRAVQGAAVMISSSEMPTDRANSASLVLKGGTDTLVVGNRLAIVHCVKLESFQIRQAAQSAQCVPRTLYRTRAVPT